MYICFLDFTVLIFNLFPTPFPPSLPQTTPNSHPPYSIPHYTIVSSLTIHPFINQLMSKVMASLNLSYTKTIVLYYPLSLSLQYQSLPLYDLRHDLYSNSESDSQPTNYHGPQSYTIFTNDILFILDDDVDIFNAFCLVERIILPVLKQVYTILYQMIWCWHLDNNINFDVHISKL